MRRLFKWLGVALAVPFVLVALLMILIYIPPVQRLIVQEAIVYASICQCSHLCYEAIEARQQFFDERSGKPITS